MKARFFDVSVCGVNFAAAWCQPRRYFAFIYLFIYACGDKIRKNNNMRRELKPAQGKQGGEAELVVHGI
jgi:hypothetical protein